MPSWEEMCQQVVVAGRPGDVATAASLWEQLLKNVTAVKESLDKNVKDLGEVWKGEAYEAFKTKVTGMATRAETIVQDAEGHDGIVQSLRNAADRLTAAQSAFPVPASCVNDVLEARNGRLVIDTGLFEMRVKPDFMGLLDPLTGLYDWINDKSEEAAKVYGDVSGDYVAVDQGMPGSSPQQVDTSPDMRTPDLGTGPAGAGGLGGAPSAGGMPSTGGIGGGGPSVGAGGLPGTGSPGIGSGAHPDLAGAGGYGSGGGYTPGTGSLADDYGSGLAGAGSATAPGLGTGGLPGTTGLGAGGGGGGAGLAGGGMIPGGGALGRPVTPGMAPMMGGGMAGAGRGGGRGAGGRLGGAGKLGAGAGMAPMMGGGAAGAGRGAGGRGAGRGVPGAGAAGVGGAAGRGAGARGGVGGVAGMGGHGGAGYGDEEVPRNTWLEEDEDVWGADGGGAPGVLR
ncbi:hypothetical protein AB0873_22265 [Micromonospora sp. NPDC047707]|uniref:WXG100 family type VII secretion target n=1 Tax=Micromonospora sp. NPDC047707 TaxID=3154498 RepID=UPI003453AD3B